MPSPFDKKSGSTATAPAAAASKAPADLPAPVGKADVGEGKPVGAKSDPFGNVADASGISGLKSSFFLGQMVLLNATEHGHMTTTVSKPGEQSEYVRFNIVPLTVPEVGQANAHTVTVDEDGNFQILNKDGDIETCEPYAIGERLEDVLIYNGPLIREGKKALDKGTTWIRGRIVKGNKKPGQSAPYILKALDEDDVDVYNAGLEIARKKMQG